MKKTKVLFIPGYFGSTLIEKNNHNLRWVKTTDFFANKKNLCMTESYSDLPVRNDVIPDKILMKVKIIPKILEVESYGKTLKHLTSFCNQNNRELHTVVYDWRDDFYESIKRIAIKISELTSEGTKIEVVAHSNGGLLLAYYLRFGDQDFEDAIENWSGTSKISKASIVASPLRGAFAVFKHLKDGTPVLKNKKLMGSLDYTSFKSTYFFLPINEFSYGHKLSNGKNKESINLFDIEIWKKNKWGPYIDTHQKELPVNDLKFKKILKRAELFQKLMIQDIQNKPNENLKIQVIRGIGRSTFFHPTFKYTEQIRHYHYPKKDRDDGDGVVFGESSRALPWFNEFKLTTVEFLNAEHLKLLSELKYQKTVHEFLVTS